MVDEESPLLTPCSCDSRQGYYGASASKRLCLVHNKSKSFSASIADGVAYFLKFQYLTNTFAKIRRLKENEPSSQPNTELYQNYLKQNEVKRQRSTKDVEKLNSKLRETQNSSRIEKDRYFAFLENAIFGTPEEAIDNLDHLVVKRNNKGLVSRFLNSVDEKRPSDEILRHNLEKVFFYEQNQACTPIDIFDGCYCRDGVTYVRGTVALSSTGACEV